MSTAARLERIYGSAENLHDEMTTVRRGDWRTARLLGRPWQDLVFAAGEVVFLIALVPLLFGTTRIPLYTGLTTSAMLYAFCTCQLSYRNWITLCLSGLTATIWLMLGIGVHL